MPNCKICGKRATGGLVVHEECFDAPLLELKAKVTRCMEQAEVNADLVYSFGGNGLKCSNYLGEIGGYKKVLEMIERMEQKY